MLKSNKSCDDYPLHRLMYNKLTFIYYNSVFIAVLMIKTQIKETEKKCLRIHNPSRDEEIIIIVRLSFNLIKKGLDEWK